MACNRAYIAEYDVSDGCPPDASLLEEIACLEWNIFPELESLAKSVEQELRKKNTRLVYAAELLPGGGGARGDVIGYVLYSWVSPLCAFITELAGAGAGLGCGSVFGSQINGKMLEKS